MYDLNACWGRSAREDERHADARGAGWNNHVSSMQSTGLRHLRSWSSWTARRAKVQDGYSTVLSRVCFMLHDPGRSEACTGAAEVTLSLTGTGELYRPVTGAPPDILRDLQALPSGGARCRQWRWRQLA